VSKLALFISSAICKTIFDILVDETILVGPAFHANACVIGIFLASPSAITQFSLAPFLVVM